MVPSGKSLRNHLYGMIWRSFAGMKMQSLMAKKGFAFTVKIAAVKTSPKEKLPREKRALAAHFITAKKDRAAFVTALQKIYSPRKKFGFPRNQKFVLNMNLADPYSQASRQSKKLGDSIRSKQRFFNHKLQSIRLHFFYFSLPRTKATNNNEVSR